MIAVRVISVLVRLDIKFGRVYKIIDILFTRPQTNNFATGVNRPQYPYITNGTSELKRISTSFRQALMSTFSSLQRQRSDSHGKQSFLIVWAGIEVVALCYWVKENDLHDW